MKGLEYLSGDDTTRIGELKAAVEAFGVERDWLRFHTPKNLAMAIAVEAAELMELFQWADSAESIILAESAPYQDRTAEELADVMIYCMALANTLGLDISTIVRHKMEANARKYPVGKTGR